MISQLRPLDHHGYDGRSVFSGILKTRNGKTVKVAVKKYMIDMGKIPYAEVRRLKKLYHENILRIYGLAALEEDGRTDHLVTELAEKGNLRFSLDERRRNGDLRLSSDLFGRWANQVISGIIYLQEANFAFKELTCRNLFVSESEILKLGDLTSSEWSLTQSEIFDRDTTRYMAPEVIETMDRSVVSTAYNYGMLIWEIYTTDIPFSDIKGEYQIMCAIVNGSRPPIPMDCPEKFSRLMRRCWSEKKTERPLCQEIKDELTNAN